MLLFMVGFMLTGCKSVPTAENMNKIGNLAGYTAAMLINNSTNINDSVKTTIVKIVQKVEMIVPETNSTYTATWTPIADKYIDEMVSNLAITQNMANNLKTTFNKVVVLVDSYIDKKNIRQYQDLMDSFVGGFCNGLKNNIKTKTLSNQRRDLDYFVLNNFEI